MSEEKRHNFNRAFFYTFVFAFLSVAMTFVIFTSTAVPAAPTTTHVHANLVGGSAATGATANITSVCPSFTDLVTTAIVVPTIHPNTLANPFQTLVYGSSPLGLNSGSTGTYSLRIADETTNFFVQLNGYNNFDVTPAAIADILFQHGISAGTHTFGFSACVSDATTTLDSLGAIILVYPGLSQGPLAGT